MLHTVLITAAFAVGGATPDHDDPLPLTTYAYGMRVAPTLEGAEVPLSASMIGLRRMRPAAGVRVTPDGGCDNCEVELRILVNEFLVHPIPSGWVSVPDWHNEWDHDGDSNLGGQIYYSTTGNIAMTFVASVISAETLVECHKPETLCEPKNSNDTCAGTISVSYTTKDGFAVYSSGGTKMTGLMTSGPDHEDGYECGDRDVLIPKSTYELRNSAGVPICEIHIFVGCTECVTN